MNDPQRSHADIRDDCEEYASHARANGYDATVLRWDSPLDDRQPVPRNYGYGFAVIYRGPVNGIYMPAGGDIPLRALTRSAALFDNGKLIRPCYVASYNPFDTAEQRDEGLHWGATGPYVTWRTMQPGAQFGPMRTWHFAVRKAQPVADARAVLVAVPS